MPLWPDFLGLPPMNLLPGWVVEESEMVSAMGRAAVPEALLASVTSGQETNAGLSQRRGQLGSGERVCSTRRHEHQG